jgi:hypothetical protein
MELTVKEAIEQGYEYFGVDGPDWQSLQELGDIDCELELDPDFLDDKNLFTKNSYSPSMSKQEIAELLADIIAVNHSEETGDDTDDVFDIVNGLDFTETANMINNALEKKRYYTLTDIKLKP